MGLGGKGNSGDATGDLVGTWAAASVGEHARESFNAVAMGAGRAEQAGLIDEAAAVGAAHREVAGFKGELVGPCFVAAEQAALAAGDGADDAAADAELLGNGPLRERAFVEQATDFQDLSQGKHGAGLRGEVGVWGGGRRKGNFGFGFAILD